MLVILLVKFIHILVCMWSILLCLFYGEIMQRTLKNN
uniref:Uncharacterized protein n=1 Tax=Rhizophora mucronata TaxID=61149 RepID=A0A2P2QGC6_RHIMU